MWQITNNSQTFVKFRIAFGISMCVCTVLNFRCAFRIWIPDDQLRTQIRCSQVLLCINFVICVLLCYGILHGIIMVTLQFEQFDSLDSYYTYTPIQVFIFKGKLNSSWSNSVDFSCIRIIACECYRMYVQKLHPHHG